MSGHRLTIGIVSMLALGLVAAPSVADVKGLLKLIPGEANVLVVCDVEKLMQSPLAAKEGWAAKRADAYANQPLVVPPEASCVVMAALVNFNDYDPVWEVSVIEMATPRSIDSIAKGESGFVDRVGDKPAAFSPLGAYFIEINPATLGVVAPGNRQFAARWVRKEHTLEGAFASQYLQSAARAVDRGTEFVLAVDLEDVIGAPRVARRLREETWNSLEGKEFDLKSLCELLASAKGLKLNIEIAETIRGTAKIEFGQDTAQLAPFAKPLLLEILSRAGFQIEGLETWEVSAEGKTLNLQGALTTEAFARIASVVQPPAPQLASAAPAPDAPPTGETQPKPDAPNSGASDTNAMRDASLKYYKAIDRIVVKLTQNLGPGMKSASMTDSASWMRRDARRINKLPILNVDPALVAWGGDVAGGLTEVANICAGGGLRTQEQTQGVQASYGHAYYYHDAYAEQLNTVDRINADRQRRSITAGQKASAIEAAAPLLQALQARTAQIRQAMTQQYNVDF